ncbi:MAG: hypothetical protein IJM14_03135 [Lachnospiraceae bacterium]|nr:hypothetical protein [Lachnospiraceae bacterium]
MRRITKIICCVCVILFLLLLIACARNNGSDRQNEERKIENTSGGIVRENDTYVFSSDEYNKVLSEYRKNISECIADYEEDINKLKQTEQTDTCNISFENCEFVDIPQIDTLEVLEYKREEISVDDAIGMIENTINRLGLNDKVNIESELKDASAQLPNEPVVDEISGQAMTDDAGNIITDYPKVLDKKDRFDSGKGFFINSDILHIQMGDCGVYSFSDGVINKNKKEPKGYCFFDIYPMDDEKLIKKGNFDELKDEKYNLLDGEISIKDAVEATKEFFKEGTPLSAAENVDIEVIDVSVYKFNDELYRYCFEIRRKYKNIPFVLGSTGHKRVNDILIDDMGKTATTISGSTVNAYLGFNEHQGFNSLFSDTRILSVYDAYLELKAKIGQNLNFNVKKVELVYVPTEAYANTDTTINIIRPKVIYPCWSFIGYYSEGELRAFIDVFTGDIYYYIQV